MTLWRYVYKIQYAFLKMKARHGRLVILLALLFLLASSAYLSPVLLEALEPRYSTDRSLDGLRLLILSLGSALIGAAAVVSSLVMFAMQVNIERMPHGLFRRLSSDPKLLSAFAGAFLSAMVVASLSLMVEASRLAAVVLTTTWGIIFTLILFLYAYRRALFLINPLRQLGIVIEDASKDLQAWSRRARRVALLGEPTEKPKTKTSPLDSTQDVARAAYFQINAHWTSGAKGAVLHAMSYARRYAEQGDYEISGAALSGVVRINAAYIEAKGKTFFASNPFIENPFAGDEFINDSLEHLRQNARSGVVRGDERQIEQTFHAMAALVNVYLSIDYAAPIVSKTHAHLAAGYLSSAVKDVIPHGMADVLLEGIRLMGRSALLFLAQGNADEIATLSKDIALIGCTGVAKEAYRSVTMEAMEQLANLTVALVRSRNDDIDFAAGQLKQDVTLVADLFLSLSDTPLSNIHSTFLGPYFSSTSPQGFRARLTALVNALSGLQVGDVDAEAVIRNIEQWSDDLDQAAKILLLKAVKVRSQFTFDMIYWIIGVTEILLATSNAPACDDHDQEELRTHALWLISTLTHIPDDKDTTAFVEGFQMTENLFIAAVDARNRGCDEISNCIRDILLDWTFKGGRHQSGWGTFEQGLYGLAVFALVNGDTQINKLKADISGRLLQNNAPDQEIRRRTANALIERAATLYNQGHWTSRIEMAIEQAEHERLRPLLEAIADLLSSGTGQVTPG